MEFMNNQNGRLNQPQEQPANNQIPQTESVLVDIPDAIEESSHKKRKICEAEVWQGIRDELVEVRIESFSPAGNECSCCSREIENIIWCPDCGPNSVYCNNCNEYIHRVVQYHQSFIWKNDVSLFVPVFREASLAQWHVCDTTYCRKITVFDALGRPHTVAANFCSCESEAATLLRHGLWPATPSKPQTAFNIELMETCRVLQLEGHVSLQKFCNAASKRINFMPHLRNSTNLYKALGNSLLEFHHHQVKCLEIAQAPDIVGKNCPVCTMKPERAVFSMDANFGLVHKMHSGSGPGLEHARFSLFSPDEEVKSFVNAHYEATSKSKNSSSDCSNFQAGDVVRSKNRSARLDIKGVFGAICHHGFPVHIVNMQHGERFGYPVYILKKIAASQAGTMHTKQTVMYDVACGLDAHLKRHSQLTERLNDKVRLVVPIFHSFAHGAKCQMTYGQRFSEGTALIDGEGMERLWSYLRRFSYTKEMTLPNRQDLLSSAFLHYARRNFCPLPRHWVQD
ncbi:uncharacterized protein LOC112574669 [Pomacea canaliculata]|uniref:uncharacterized protein LOC112574669 n=1 Tax=Pomacea canaliculata TaxID=400727 RepID=UPI000D739D16|nr:uncharacterized protein LOC112574669 [Pomacea canaliculata]